MYENSVSLPFGFHSKNYWFLVDHPFTGAWSIIIQHHTLNTEPQCEPGTLNLINSDKRAYWTRYSEII